MTYTTLMVHLQLGRSNATALNVAGELAEHCQANVIAIAACQPLFAVGGDIYSEAMELDRAQLQTAAAEAEAEARALMEGRAVRLDWRFASMLTSTAEHIACEARSADLIIAAPDRGGSFFPEPLRVKIGDVLMRAGRPLLLVPERTTGLALDHVMVAWKESREARRATLDALPLLKLSRRVTVVEVVSGEDSATASDRLKDVVSWLGGHGIRAEYLAKEAGGGDVTALARIARRLGADAVVAGAYGHSRLREWVFGGVTMDLLINPSLPAFLSH